MKHYLLIAIGFICAAANALTFDSSEVQTIRKSAHVMATSQSFKVLFAGDKSAICTVNTMMELPGFRCRISDQSDDLKVTSDDFKNIENSISDLATGQSEIFVLKFKESVSCSVHSMLELPGYRCTKLESSL